MGPSGRDDGPSAVAAAGAARLRNAVDERARLAAGELGLDVYGPCVELERLGVRYMDRDEHTDDDRDGVVPEGAAPWLRSWPPPRPCTPHSC